MTFHRTIRFLATMLAALASINAYAVADWAAASRSYAPTQLHSFATGEASSTGEATPAEMFLLGAMLDEGIGVPRNYGQALLWYACAAQAGHAEAMNRLGIMHAIAHGVPRDYGLAFEWYLKAVKSGSVSAINNIATAYFNGLGVSQSYTEAARWLRVVAVQGDPRAQNKLAVLYREGLGVPRDPAMALDLLKRAAAQGYAPAMANLGCMYADGIGVQRDDVRAYALLHAALEMDVPTSLREISYDQLGRVAARLNGRKLPRAYQLSREMSATETQSMDPILPR